MFLQLAHTRLDAFTLTKEFVLSCYKASKQLPSEEKFNRTQQLRRAALSVHLNLAEGVQENPKLKGKDFMKYREVH
jgi:four helix bundle protein